MNANGNNLGYKPRPDLQIFSYIIDLQCDRRKYGFGTAGPRLMEKEGLVTGFCYAITEIGYMAMEITAGGGGIAFIRDAN